MSETGDTDKEDENGMLHLTLRMPKPLIDDLDTIVEVHRFSSRQEALRQAVRDFVNAKRVPR